MQSSSARVPGEDKIKGSILDELGQNPRYGKAVRFLKGIVPQMKRFIRSPGKALPEHLFRVLRSNTYHGNLAADLFLDLNGLFHREAIPVIDVVVQVILLDVLGSARYGQVSLGGVRHPF